MSIILADTHAHLYWESFQEELDEVLQRSLEAGVSTIINVGVDVEKSEQALKQVQGELSNIPDLEVYSTIGIHPHNASRYHTYESIHKDIERLEEIYNSNPKKVVAVGECGLDFLFESNPDFNPTSLPISQIKDLQRQLFKAHVELAKKLDLPLLIHVRDDRTKDPNNTECWNEAVEMAKAHYGVFHCYSGLPSTTNQILSTPYYFSFAANITYPKNEYLREIAKLISLDRILLETDCPFLAPQSKRGQRNEPSSVLEIAQLIAELKGISLDEVANQTTQNVKKLFKLVK